MRSSPRLGLTSGRLPASLARQFVRLAVATVVGLVVAGCRTMSGPPTLTGAGRAVESQTSFVVVDQRESAFVIFSGIAAEAGEATLARARSDVAAQAGVDIVSWTQFLDGLDGYAASVVVRNDYPSVSVADGVACLVAKAPGSPWGLTWNGGIALSRLDYEHVRSTYAAYQAGEAGAPLDPPADPVHPGGFLPAFGCLWLRDGAPSPLHEAAERGDAVAVEQLIAEGADMLVADRNGDTPLHRAAALGRTAVVEALLEHGMDPNQPSFSATWCVCPGGSTPLYDAAVFGHTDTARLLLDRGAAVDLTVSVVSATPLRIAAWHGHIDVVRLLLDRGADVNLQTAGDQTALHQAAERGHTDVVALLLDRSADPNLQTTSGETPLFRALRSGKLDTAAVLIRLGADVNHRSRDASTPLHIGVLDYSWNDPERAVELLLDAGADPSAEDERGETPIDLAMRAGLPRVAETLKSRLGERER